jgi:hypothetical protein
MGNPKPFARGASARSVIQSVARQPETRALSD